MNLEHIESLLGRKLLPYQAVILTLPGNKRKVIIETPRGSKSSDWTSFTDDFGLIPTQCVTCKTLKSLGRLASDAKSCRHLQPDPSTARGYSGTHVLL